MRGRTLRRLRLAPAVGCALIGATACSGVESFTPVTTQGEATTWLFSFVLVLSAIVFILVAGMLVYIVARYRGREGEADPVQVAGHHRLEIAWTAAAFALVIVLFVPSLHTMASVDAPAANALRIQVIGHQWWWEYRYPDLGVVTADEVHVPVGQPLAFDLGAADVVHSFWLPRFGWKRDAIPGKTNVLAAQVEQPGVYDGTCTEYCGLQHAWMRIRVVAQSADDFNAWVALQRQPGASPQTDIEQRGAQVFAGNTCVECHTVRGTGAAGDAGPDLTHVGGRSILASGVIDNNPDNLARFVRDADSIKPGILMPTFRSLSDDDAAALAAYLSGLK